MRLTRRAVAATASLVYHTATPVYAYEDNRAASGVRAWIDMKTPSDAFDYTSSRGDKWELVMSDEFDTPGRSFAPGDDHLWTAMEGTDGASRVSYYTKELATTECEENVGCYLKLATTTTPRAVSLWNAEASPPRMENTTVYYQSAMLQSWNKFCFQGGMVEVRAKLPGAVNAAASKNPDLANGATARVKNAAFYPTWPGVWLMGNLGRALFRDSMDRMWPFSYSQCESDVFDPKHQRISACDEKPGSGMNPNQGRGAPEIGLFEAGGVKIASTLQIGPGMPTEFRRVAGESATCVYSASGCQTQGANVVGVPKNVYESRNHKSWYQGLRYAFNPLCANDERSQSPDAIQSALAQGVSSNTCDVDHCPASFDIHSDLSPIGASSKYGARWGINTDGSCSARMNPFDGLVVCDRLNKDPECTTMQRRSVQTAPPQNASQDAFTYRTDALSANWPAHVAVYTEFLEYQVEWVPGDDGYIRWMLQGHPLFEIPAEAVTTPPQDADKKNPRKMLPEEPMYLIMNVALASTSSTEPPSAGTQQACGNATTTANKTIQAVCEQFPMALKIDYVRVYQDVSSSSTMSVGCDPASHPTKQWILDHLKEYENDANRVVAVSGKAFCATDDDCSVAGQAVGSCKAGRCTCDIADWSGPRCTVSASSSTARNPRTTAKPAVSTSDGSGGGPEITLGVAAGVVLVMLFTIIAVGRQVQRCTLFRKMTPSNHNVRAMIVEPPLSRSAAVANYNQLTPPLQSSPSTASSSSSSRKGHYRAHGTPTIDLDDARRPDFVVQL